MFMCDMLKEREIKYDLRVKDLLQLPNTKITSYRINYISFKGEGILWNSINDVIKKTKALPHSRK